VVKNKFWNCTTSLEECLKVHIVEAKLTSGLNIIDFFSVSFIPAISNKINVIKKKLQLCQLFGNNLKKKLYLHFSIYNYVAPNEISFLTCVNKIKINKGPNVFGILHKNVLKQQKQILKDFI
jgi:hypothetical protein